MNRSALCLIPASAIAILALAGCGTATNEIVPLRDGLLRAPTYAQAQDYCNKKGLTMHQRGNAPAQNGIQFSCEKD